MKIWRVYIKLSRSIDHEEAHQRIEKLVKIFVQNSQYMALVVDNDQFISFFFEYVSTQVHDSFLGLKC